MPPRVVDSPRRKGPVTPTTKPTDRRFVIGVPVAQLGEHLLQTATQAIWVCKVCLRAGDAVGAGDGIRTHDNRHAIASLVRKPAAFARYRYREHLFPTSIFRRAYVALSRWRGERADVDYLRVLHLAATTMEVVVERALAQLLEAGGPFDYTVVRDLAAPIRPATPELAKLSPPDLRVYDGLLQAVTA